MLINRKPVQKGGIGEKCSFSPLLWRWPLKPLKQHLTQQMVGEYLMFFQLFTHAVNLLHSNPALRTPNWVITDNLLCPWGKKALTFSLNSTRLIRTLSVAPSVSVLTGFDYAWWPTTVTAKPKSSQQKQNTSRQKQNISRQNWKPHGKNKIPHAAKPKTSKKQKPRSQQNQKPHGKNKIPHGKTKDLTAKPNTSQ